MKKKRGHEKKIFIKIAVRFDYQRIVNADGLWC